MKLFEYQAKELFKEAGIPVPLSYLIENEKMKMTWMLYWRPQVYHVF